MAREAQNVPDSITERFLGNRSVGTTASGCDDPQEVVASYVGFQNLSVPMTVIGESYQIRF
jgi:hypothetical protein